MTSQLDHKNPSDTPNPFAKLIDRAEYSKLRGISYRTAEMEAHKGIGPKVVKIGRKAYYHLDDIEAWIEAQRTKAAKRFERKAGA